tara:strand:+ start:456 stop:2054 length:1599 start_codon:yes stop_codon:yes gene_type:complete
MNSKGVLAGMAAILGGVFLLNNKEIKEAETIVFNARKPKNKTRLPYAPPEYLPITVLSKPLEIKDYNKTYNWKNVIKAPYHGNFLTGGWGILNNKLPVCQDNPVVEKIVKKLFTPIVENILQQKLGSVPVNKGMGSSAGKKVAKWALKYPKDYAVLEEIPLKAINQLWNNGGVTPDELLVMQSINRQLWGGVFGGKTMEDIKKMISTNTLISNKISYSNSFDQMLKLLIQNMKNLNWISTENEKLVKWMELSKQIEVFEEQLSLANFSLEKLNNLQEIENRLKKFAGNKFSTDFYLTPMLGTIRYRLVSWFILYYNALDSIPFGTKYIYQNIRGSHDAYQKNPGLQRYDNRYPIKYYQFESDSQGHKIYEFKDGKYELKEGSVVTKVFATKEFLKLRPTLTKAIQLDIKLFNDISVKRKDEAYDNAIKEFDEIPTMKMYEFSPYLILTSKGRNLRAKLKRYKDKIPLADYENYKRTIEKQLNEAIVESEKEMLEKKERNRIRVIKEHEELWKMYGDKEKQIIFEELNYIDDM